MRDRETVAYNFNERFAGAVKTGVKKSTIRGQRIGRSRHALPGEPLRLYTGMKTKECKKLLPNQICSNVQRIVIIQEPLVSVILDDFVLSAAAVEELAVADGFDDVETFAGFFRENYGLPFEGVLISWY